jgi:MFS family permease
MDKADEARPSKRTQRALDWVNFLIADVQAGFGSFVAVYLASLNWSQGQIGLLLTVSTLASIASQAPGGALVDAAGSKRLLIGGAVAAIGARLVPRETVVVLGASGGLGGLSPLTRAASLE